MASALSFLLKLGVRLMAKAATLSCKDAEFRDLSAAVLVSVEPIGEGKRPIFRLE